MEMIDESSIDIDELRDIKLVPQHLKEAGLVPKNLVAPGLKVQISLSDEVSYFWSAAVFGEKAKNYRPRLVRLTGPSTAIARDCRTLSDKLNGWIERGRAKPEKRENTPGLKVRERADGSTAYYWVASAVSRDTADYPQKTVRLHGADDEIAATCRRLTSELKVWLSRKGLGNRTQYDGTMRSVINLYRRTAESSYFTVKSNTKAMYDESLDLLERTIGDRRLEKLTGLDFTRWHMNFAKPAEDTTKQATARAEAKCRGIDLPANPLRPRRAYKAMQLLRIVIKFGVVVNITECFRLATILENMEFSPPKARKERITFEQTQAICEKAIARGWVSLALAQALEFELTLRQIDVIGRWEKVDDDSYGGIVDRGRRWIDGLLWSHLEDNGILTKTTSKVDDVVAEHDTMAYPFLRSIIDMIPPSQRIGPMIKCETTGLPYRYRHFADRWREVATEAGVPTNVWNRDSRAGGVTEGSDAGADIEHLRHHANHKNAATTQRYNRKTIEKTRTVAHLRIAKRNAANGSDTGL